MFKKKSAPRSLITLFRITHWTKNFAIFIGPIASGQLGKPGVFSSASTSFLGFCLISSSVYIFNDLVDFDNDLKHFQKKYRPLPSGEISKRQAIQLSGILLPIGLILLFSVSISVLAVGIIYALINIFYSLKWKNLVVIDLISVASGFILRGLVGVLAIPATPTVWFIMLSLFGSLLLVSGKRYSEFQRGFQDFAARPVLLKYNQSYLKFVIDFSSAGLITAYGLMAFEKSEPLSSIFQEFMLKLSILPFLITLMIIVFDIYAEKAEKPENFAKDPRVLIFGGIWLATFACGVYV